jgi:hypothetical protein
MRGNLGFFLLLLLLLWGGNSTQAGQDIDLSGYLQGSLLQYGTPANSAASRNEQYEYRLHNRLNLRWDLAAGFSLHGGLRTRLFAGDLVRTAPHYVKELRRDPGLLNLSATLVDQDNLLLVTNADRLFAEWDRNDWLIRAGRQRVNWGINMITNPNDIFNIYSIYAIDYPERPGSDALRIQRFTGFGSRVELVISPGHQWRETVAAALYGFNFKGYDVQIISGYYRDRIAVGGGWAGNLNGAGFKGEVMLFHDLAKQKDNDRHNINTIIAVSLDYMFENGLFVVTELLYNEDGDNKGGELPRQSFPSGLAADNPSLTRYQGALQLSFLIHPLVNSSLTGVYFFQEKALFVSPALTWSVRQNIDLTVSAQLFNGGSNTLLEQTADLYMASLKYNF